MLQKPQIKFNQAILGEELYIHPKEDGIWIQCAYKKVTVHQLKQIRDLLTEVIKEYEK